jgi:7,8-didemethyl-8-hydroxy-5-deazariboflavin synthase
MPCHGVVTYSPAYTLVPTYECFNRCHYCNFRTDPGQSPWLSLEDAAAQLQPLRSAGMIEILILSGEVHPRSDRRPGWFQHIYDLCTLALSLGFLPHTNAGPLSFEEMARLKGVNVSLGLMLEQVTPELLKTVHRAAPSKVPELRLQQLAWAGELQIPFTTGVLLGIGETEAERIQSLEAIAQLQEQWGHIQEVILQPYRPGQRELGGAPGFPLEQLPDFVAIARRILPASVTLQVPPNLMNPSQLLACLEAGARDLGGIGPLDHVNPNYPHQQQVLTQILVQAGWQVSPRLPVYPQYDPWLTQDLQVAVHTWRQSLAETTCLGPPQR